MAAQVSALEYGSKILSQLGSFKQGNKRSICQDISNMIRKSTNNPEDMEKVSKPSKKSEKIQVTKKKSISIKPRLPTYTSSSKGDPQLEPYIESIKKLMIKQQSQICFNKKLSKLDIELEINRLIIAHGALRLKQQTLYLALSYFIQFYSKSSFKNQEDRLLAVMACLWIASKYQQIYPPPSYRILKFLQQKNIDDLLNMEAQILTALNFRLVRTTPLAILQLLCQDNTNVYCLSNYLLQSLYIKKDDTIMEQPVLAVLGAYKISNHIFNTSQKSKHLQSLNKFSQKQFSQCFKKFCLLLQADSIKSTALKKKFGDDHMFKVSKICLLPK